MEAKGLGNYARVFWFKLSNDHWNLGFFGKKRFLDYAKVAKLFQSSCFYLQSPQIAYKSPAEALKFVGNCYLDC